MAAALVLVHVHGVTAAVLTADQAACINEMNKRGAAIALQQTKTGSGCLGFAAAGKGEKLGLPGQTRTAQACLTNDVPGTIAKALAKLQAGEQLRCLARPEQLPSFGYVPSGSVSESAQGASLELIADLFGPDLDAAVTRSDRAGASCQAFVLKQVAKLYDAMWKLALKAKKDALKCSVARPPGSCAAGGVSPVSSGAELEAVLTAALAADVKGTIAKTAAVLRAKSASLCTGIQTPLTVLFPGGCVESADPTALGGCAERAARGRFCRTLNAADGLGAVCPPIPGVAPDLSAPPVVEFGLVEESVAVEEVVTLENKGADVLQIATLSVQGTGFALVLPDTVPFSIPPGGSRSVAVRFQPGIGTGGTTAAGTLRIGSDDPDEPLRNVRLSADVSPPRPPLDDNPVARARVAAGGVFDVMTPATCAVIDVNVDLTGATAPGDLLTVILADEAGGTVTGGPMPAGTGPRTTTVSALNACGLADGVITPRVVVHRGGRDLPAVPGKLAVKNSSALPPPVLEPLPGVPVFVTLSPVVNLCGTSRSGTTVDVRGGAHAVQVTLDAATTTFCVDVPLRLNQPNTLIATATDDLTLASPRPRASAPPVEVIHLDPAQAVLVATTSRPLTTAEVQNLVAAGVINLSDTANFNVSEFTLVLNVGGRMISVQQVVPVPVGSGSVAVAYGMAPLPPAGGGGGGGAAGDSLAGRAGWVPDATRPNVVLPPPPGQGGCRTACAQVIVVTTPTGQTIPGVIILDGRIKTLKEFFQIGIVFTNTSPAFTLADVAARVIVPGGLTPISAGLGTDVAGVELGGVTDAIGIGSIAPGATAGAQFIIRGDQIGTHAVQIAFEGFIAGAPLPAPVPFSGSAATTVEVLGPPELGVLVRHPSRIGQPDVTLNEIYPLLVEITNLSDRPALYTSVEIFLGGNALLVDENDLPVPGSSATRSVGHILPGQTVSLVYRVQSLVAGDIIACQGIASENITLSVDTGPDGATCDIAGTVPSGGLALPPEAAPVVSGFAPANGAVDVADTATVLASLAPRSACLVSDTFVNVATAFIVPVNPGSGLQVVGADLATTGTFRLEELDVFGRPAAAVPTDLALANPPAGGTTIAVLRPGLASPLSQVFLRPDTTYRATLVGGSGGVCSAASGAALPETVRWAFRTASTCGGPAPTVTLREPQNGATDRPIDQEVVLDFSGRMDPGTLTGASFAVVRGGVVSSGDVVGGTAVAGTARFENDNRTLRFRPDGPLPSLTTIHVRLRNTLRNACGSALVTGGNGVQLFAFETAPPDLTPPASPAADPVPSLTRAVQVVVTGTAEAGSTVTVTGGAGPASSGRAGGTGLFAVPVALVLDATNALSVQATDPSGNPSLIVTTDTNGAPLHIRQDATAPSVVSIAPAGGVEGVPINAAVAVVFSEPIVPASVDASTFTLSETSPIPGTFQLVGDTGFTFAPSAPLPTGAPLTVRIRAGGVRDLAGNPVTADFISTFTTSGGPPIITGIVPGNALQGSIVTAQIEGQNLAGVTSISVAGTGVQVFDLGTGSSTRRNVRFVVDAAAPVGSRTVTVTTPSGSGSGTFGVLDSPVNATIQWITPGGGDWNVAANWLPARVPLATDDVRVATTGPVAFAGTQVVRSLVLLSELDVQGQLTIGPGVVEPAAVVHQQATLRVGTAGTVTVRGGLTLNGAATLASGNVGAFAARVQLAGTQTVDGTGVFQFAPIVGLPDAGFVEPTENGVVTMGAGLTVHGGDGTLGGSGGALVFLGRVMPDVAGRMIDLAGVIDNAGQAMTVQSGPGHVRLNGGTIRRATVQGINGTLETVSTTGTLETVTLNANLRVGTAETVTVRGGLTLNGTATLASGNVGAFAARVQLAGTQTVDGTGAFVFAPITGLPEAGFVEPTEGGVVTLAAGLLVAGGDGTLGGPNGSLVFLGTLSPDVGGRAIGLAGVIDNAGQSMTLLGTGTVRLNGGTIRRATVQGDGTLATLSTTGTLESVVLNANLRLDGGATLLDAVVLNGTLRVGTAGTVTVRGGLTLNGTATLASGNVGAFAARVQMAGTQTVDGTGAFVFAPITGLPEAGFVEPTEGGAVTLGAGLTVRGGDGTLGGSGGSLVFLGTVVPDVAGRIVDLAGVIDNAGQAMTVQSGSGHVRLNGATIRRATVQGAGTLETVSSTGTFETLVLNANLRVGTAETVTVRGGLTLNGTATLASGNVGAFAARVRLAGTQTVDGTGAFVFAPITGLPEAGFVEPTEGGVVTLAAGLTVSGADGTLGGPGGSLVSLGTVRADVSGRVLRIGDGSVQNRGMAGAVNGGTLRLETLSSSGGTLFAGASGVVSVIGSLSLSSNDIVAIELGDGTAAGRIDVTGVATLGGTLSVTRANAFIPTLGLRFRVMTFASRLGGFSSVTGTSASGGVALSVDETDPTDIELVALPG